ncbi:AAA domain-containing protein [Rothia nasimurium]|uniref:AAA domain-containing protein n=1 Tax=Rothia nasimurium TaxID=85336 RepID=UPI001F38B602|nr:AAA domain-containing protein [Rothia nasimurium]
MNQVTQQLTGYFRDVQKRSNLVDQAFGQKNKYKVIPFLDVRLGKLSEEDTQELFDWDADAQGRFKKPRTQSGSQKAKPIDVIISVVTLTDAESDTKNGLALIAAKLTDKGELQADITSTAPWIPSSRLQSPSVIDHEFMVGTLADYWRWSNTKGSELASKIETWSDVIDYSTSMYEGVVEPALHEGVDPRWVVDIDNCYITPGTVINANVHVLSLYQFLHATEQRSPLYERLLSTGKPQNFQSDAIDTNTDTLLESALRTCGSMSDQFPLTASQRRAVHAFMHDGYGDITAVSGPPGTGKTTMLQSVVASMLVSHALEAKPAPLIVGMSTNNQAVTNIIDSFGSVTKDDPGVLEHRWLLKAEDGAASSDFLGGLAAYCPSQAKAKEARAKGYLLEDTAKKGVYSEYSSEAYLQESTQYFLEQISDYYAAFSLPAVNSLEQAKRGLAAFLASCEEQKRALLHARREADRRVHSTSAQLTEELARLSQEQSIVQSRLDAWSDQSASPLPAEVIISATYDPHEPADEFSTVEAFVDFYRGRLDEIGLALSNIDNRIAAAVTEEELASHQFKQQAEPIISQVRHLALLNDTQVARLLNARSLLELDQALDITLRYVEFWLAVHYYEAEWLLSATDEEQLIADKERFKNTPELMVRYWEQVASLTPCFVMTAYQVPRYFKLYAPQGEPDNFDIERIDLLIVDEAGQVDTSVGAGAFALAKRALVVGDVQQLAPVWSLDPETDQGIAEAHELGWRWDSMKEFGLTSSHSSSLMLAAAQSSNWVYSAKNHPGLFLSEHFRCHTDIIEYCNDLLYDGLLVPSRPLKGYKLEGKTPGAFLFQLVENSQDRRNGSSRVNSQEAEAIADWIIGNFEYFRAIYNPDADAAKDKSLFAVVTPFAAQAREVRKTLRMKSEDLADKVTVGTAHTLQGAERQVVLFSPVYGDNSDKASFVDGTLELMNVAVSRAKDLFIAFGGQRRWEDTGPVFGLVRQRAVIGPHWFGYGGSQGLAFKAPASFEEERTPQPTPPAPAPASAPTPVQQAPWARQDEPPMSVPQPTPVPPLAPEPKMVDRHKPGYLIATELIEMWKESGVLPNDSKVKARQFNAAMDAAGLLTKVDGTWCPTAEGVSIGIAQYQGGSGERTYVSPIYSPQAREILEQMVVSGRLDF